MLEALQRRIAAEPGKFTLSYTESDVQNIFSRGRELGLDDRTIEDLLFTGSRTSKAISASELIRQIENYALEVRPRGFPYRFDDREGFQRFQTNLQAGLAQVGLPTSDVRIQGSSLRNPNAKDIDVAIFMNDASFNAKLLEFFAGKVKQQGSPVNLAGMSHEELASLAEQIRQDDINRGGAFNAQARTFANAFHSRKIRPEDVPGLRAIKKQIEAEFGEMDVSIMSHGGNFDMEPNMRF